MPALMTALLLLGAAAPPAAAPKPLVIVKPTLHQYEDGPPVTPGAGFSTGETAFFSFQVSGYKLSEDSQVDLACRIDALDPQGVPLVATILHEVKTTLSPEDKDWMPIVRQSFLIPPLALPGAFRIVIAVDDRLASQSTKTEIQFPVHGRQVAPSDTLVARDFRFLRAEDDPRPLQPPLYRPGDALWARFEIVGYKLGEKNRVQVSYGVSVVSPSGKSMYSEPNAAVEQGESFYPKRYLPGMFSLNLNKDVRPGVYTVVLTLRDDVGNQTGESKHEFTVE